MSAQEAIEQFAEAMPTLVELEEQAQRETLRMFQAIADFEDAMQRAEELVDEGMERDVARATVIIEKLRAIVAELDAQGS